MRLLRQSTIVTVTAGPFVDSTDGASRETGLTLAQASIELVKNNGAYAQKNGAAAGAHDSRGNYKIPLNAVDTSQTGLMRMDISGTGALPVWEDFMVITANVYDSLVLGTDELVVDQATLSSTLGTVSTDVGVISSTIGVAGVGLTSVTVASVGTGGINNASFDADVGSTAYATNVIALAGRKVLDELNLDHLLKVTTGVAADGDLGGHVITGTVASHLMATDLNAAEYQASTDSFQASRDAITAAADVNYPPDSDSTVNTGDETNAYTDAIAIGGDSWTIGDANGDSGARHSATSDYTIDVIAEFSMGTGRVATQLDVVGYFDRSSGSNKVEMYAYNFITTDWDKLSIGTVDTEMRNRASNKEYTLALNTAHTNKSTTVGDVKIGFVGTDVGATADGDVLYLDYITIAGASSGGATPQAIATAVHASLDEHFDHIPLFTGEIWYVSKDGNDANSGRVPDNAVSTVAAAITLCSAGDQIRIKAGTYDEDGLDLNLDGLELHAEIGAIFKNTNPGTVLTVSGNYCLVDGLTLEAAITQTAILVSGDFCRLNDSYPRAAGAISWSVTGEHNVFTRCRADNYSVTGFNITNEENIFDQCIANGAGTTTTGFHLSHTNAHDNLLNQCVSNNNDGVGVHAVSGADNNVIQMHNSSSETTPYTDGGTGNTWRGFMSADLAGVNVIEVGGTSQTAGDLIVDIGVISSTVAAIDTSVNTMSTSVAMIYTGTGCGDGDSPVGGSLAESMRWLRWFAKNEWRIDEDTGGADTLKIYKDDGSTEGFGFTVYTAASVNYRDPA